MVKLKWCVVKIRLGYGSPKPFSLSQRFGIQIGSFFDNSPATAATVPFVPTVPEPFDTVLSTLTPSDLVANHPSDSVLNYSHPRKSPQEDKQKDKKIILWLLLEPA